MSNTLNLLPDYDVQKLVTSVDMVHAAISYLSGEEHAPLIQYESLHPVIPSLLNLTMLWENRTSSTACRQPEAVRLAFRRATPFEWEHGGMTNAERFQLLLYKLVTSVRQREYEVKVITDAKIAGHIITGLTWDPQHRSWQKDSIGLLELQSFIRNLKKELARLNETA